MSKSTADEMIVIDIRKALEQTTRFLFTENTVSAIIKYYTSIHYG